MGKAKHILVRILIVIISVLCVDAGRSYFYFGNLVQMELEPDHVKDTGEPHHHYPNNFIDDEKLLLTDKLDFSCFAKNIVKYTTLQNNLIRRYSDSIWQPPKSF